MKMKWNNNYVKWGITAFSVIACGVLFFYLVFNGNDLFAKIKELISILSPVIVGFIIAYLLSPMINFFEGKILYPISNKLRIKTSKTHKGIVRFLSITLTLATVYFIIHALIAMLVSQIVPSIKTIVNNFDTYVNNANTWLNSLPLEKDTGYGIAYTVYTKLLVELENWLADTASLIDRSGELLKTLSTSVLNVLGFAWNTIIGLIISIYVLSSKETFVGQAKKIIYAIFDRITANKVIDSLRFTHKTFGGFISGKILDSLIIGILCFIGTSIIGTPYAALVSVIVGVTNIIPYFGPFLGAIPSAFLILIVDLSNPLNCVYFVIFILLLQQFDGNFLGPLILGDSTGLSGFWVLCSITIFGALFGIPGMIIGVPTFAVLYAAIKGLVNGALEKKNLPNQTELYLKLVSVDEEGRLIEQTPAPKEKRSSSDKKNHTKIGTKFSLKRSKKYFDSTEKETDDESNNN